MGLGPDAIQVGAWNVGKLNGKKKDCEAEGPGCWIKLWFIGSCLSPRSKGDSSISVSGSQYESKSTNDTSRHEPVLPVASTSTTSTAESTPSTPNVDQRAFLGRGVFGCVFRGWINENGTAPVKPGTGLSVAVKTLKHDGLQGHKEWLAEVNYLSDLLHPNLVKLIGYCIVDDQRLLVYASRKLGESPISKTLRKFIPKPSTSTCFDLQYQQPRSLPLPWSTRMKFALGAAKGLAFLHEEAERPVIYRDFKTSNILLDVDYNAKLSDFGLAKGGPEGDKTHVSTRVMGTYGYAAPVYVMTGHLTSKSDVYSFGVVLLEMLTGRRSMDKNQPNGEQNLVEWAQPYLGEKRRFY
ncbi:hypothetical protein SLEP1_g10336 [Rubroshorea leprosula]|uniref:non-specific serine/threonine protein kinase n=1 Tax=Rubroshorea leprosula TaxID=152421 RepID=A0AAV5I7T0_9ROSI|nr:hypothetical protein SLEP1_g10336 [Rubroshorea leprosula]